MTVSRLVFDRVYTRFAIAAIEFLTLAAAVLMLSAAHAQDLDAEVSAAEGYDVEAYAVQAANPNLVVNGSFANDLSGWLFVDPASSWDALDAAVNPQSGSLEVNEPFGTPLDELSAARQCVVLPAPGTYQLTAKVNSGAPAIFQDYLKLRWAFGSNGSDCADIGTKYAELTFPLGSGWKQPASPALIEVSPQLWTPASVIFIELVIEKNQGEEAGAITGRFDDVSLVLRGDTVFKDNFEQPIDVAR